VARLIALFLYISGIGFPAHSWLSDVLPFRVKITVTAFGALAIIAGVFVQWKWSTKAE
jgi:hypothetical protein